MRYVVSYVSQLVKHRGSPKVRFSGGLGRVYGWVDSFTLFILKIESVQNVWSHLTTSYLMKFCVQVRISDGFFSLPVLSRWSTICVAEVHNCDVDLAAEVQEELGLLHVLAAPPVRVGCCRIHFGGWLSRILQVQIQLVARLLKY